MGYAAKETNAGGNTMLGGQFMNVSGGTDQFKLSDLVVTGYNKDDGAWGELKLTVLNNAGMADTDADGNKMNYFWYDNEDLDAGWYDINGEVQWPETTSFPAGQGFWIYGEGLVVEFTNPAAPAPAE